MADVKALLFKDFEQRRQLRHFDIEIAGEKCRIFYAPVMSQDQQSAIFKHIDGETGRIDPEAFLTSAIVRCLNEDGTRIFSESDRKELRTKVDATKWAEIAAKMGGLVEEVDPKKS